MGQLTNKDSGRGSRPYPLDHERRKNVLVALAEQEMTISSLSKNIGTPRAIVSQIVSGRRLSPKTEQRIASFLGKKVDDLFPYRSPKQIEKMREAEAKAKRRTA